MLTPPIFLKKIFYLGGDLLLGSLHYMKIVCTLSTMILGQHSGYAEANRQLYISYCQYSSDEQCLYSVYMRILSLNQPKTTLAILRRWQLGALHVNVSKVTRKSNSWYSLHPTAANQKMSLAHIVLWVVSLSSIECVDVDMFEALSRL
jgi:hypothetical protein